MAIPYTTKHSSTPHPPNFTARYLPKRKETYILPKLLLYVIAQNSEGLSVKLNKVWYIYRIEHNSAIKRNYLLIHTIWMTIKTYCQVKKKKNLKQKFTSILQSPRTGKTNLWWGKKKKKNNLHNNCL